MTTALKNNAMPAALTLLMFIAASFAPQAGSPTSAALSSLLGLN